MSDRSEPTRSGDVAPLCNVLLVGFMGSGKTTVGRALARRLGWEFADFDAEVERRAGRSVPRNFAEWGESAFRALEALMASSISD